MRALELVGAAIISLLLSMSTDSGLNVKTYQGIPDQYGFITKPKFVHHNYKQLEKSLTELHQSYPSMTRLGSIGNSVQGREIYVLEIAKNPGKHEPEKPEVRFTANIHGNEVVGRELLLLLAKYLCETYGRDPRSTRIVNGIRLHLLPTLNPDGYEIATEGDADGTTGQQNANNVNLLTDFELFKLHKDASLTQPEIQAYIKWMSEIEFLYSGTFHAATWTVSNFPFSSIVQTGSNEFKERTTEDEVFKMLAHAYADSHPSMSSTMNCPDKQEKRHAKYGQMIDNVLYPEMGGAEEHSYYFHHCFDVSIELGCYKFPKADKLEGYWKDNQESLLRYLEAAGRGVYGAVTSSIGSPVFDAIVSIEGKNLTKNTSKTGYYHFLLPPGAYKVAVNMTGYEPLSQFVQVPPSNDGTRLDFTLIHDDPSHWTHLNDYDLRDNLKGTKYQTTEELSENYKRLELQKPVVAEYKADDSPISAAMHSFKITHNMGSGEETKIHISFIGGLFASQPVGREILLRFARHVMAGYQEEDPFIVKLLGRIVLYFLPAVDPAFDRVTDSCNPAVDDEVGSRLYSQRNSTQLDVVTNAFEQTFLTEDFDAIVLFGGGSGVNVSYESDEIDIFKNFASYYRSSLQTSQCDTRTDDIKNVQDYIKKRYKLPVMSFSLSCCKYPEARSIPMIWRKNLGPLRNLVKRLSTGVLISVKDSANKPLRKTKVRIGAASYNVSKNMAYFKTILPPGIYDAVFSCQGYNDESVMITVVDEQLTRMDVVLTPNPISGSTEKNEFAQDSRSESHRVLNQILDDLNGKYPKISTLHEIGITKRNHKLMALEIHPEFTHNHAVSRPSVVFSAGIAAGSTVTSKVLTHFSTHILTSYNTDNKITYYVKNFSIFIVPNLNPDSDARESCSYISEDILQFPLEDGKIEYYENALRIAKWFEKVKPIAVVNLRVGSLHVEIPYASPLGKSSHAPYKTDDDDALQRLSLSYALNHPVISLVNSRCESTVIVEKSGTAHAGVAIKGAANNSFLDYLYLKANALPLDAYIACCGSADDTQVWLENNRSLTAVLGEIDKGLTGYVVTESDAPVAGATITHDHSAHRVVSQADGAYWLLLSPGSHKVSVDAPGYYRASKSVNVTDERSAAKLMFKLRRNENILGMPHALFVIMTGAVLVILIAGCVFVITKCQSKRLQDKNSRRSYSFSLLRDGNTFFDDDEKEVEIFKRPCKEYKEDASSVAAEPYFDDDENSSSDGGSDLEFIRPDREWQGKTPE